MGAPMLPGETAAEYAARIKREGGGGGTTPTTQQTTVQTPVASGGFGETPYATVDPTTGQAPAPKTSGLDVVPTEGAGKDYTVANILDLMGIGKFTPEQAKAELERIGYDPTEADNLLALGQTGAGSAPEISLSQMFQAAESGVMTMEQVRQRLLSTGYSEQDADILIGTATKSMAEQAKELAYRDAQRADSAADEARSERRYAESEARRIANEQESDRRYAVSEQRYKEGEARRKENEREADIMNANSAAARAAGQSRVIAGQTEQGQRPQARQMLDDFRSSFVRNLKENGTGLSMPQKQWALENMDTFLPNFLGTTEGATFTLGAQEIATAYEGSRNTQRSNKSGSGLIQTRGL